jgi:hypothetical protein
LLPFILFTSVIDLGGSFEVAPLKPRKRFFKPDNALVSHWILGVCRNSKVDEKSIVVLFTVKPLYFNSKASE